MRLHLHPPHLSDEQHNRIRQLGAALLFSALIVAVIAAIAFALMKGMAYSVPPDAAPWGAF